jgi:polyisoprenoid-binding protein YceI
MRSWGWKRWLVIGPVVIVIVVVGGTWLYLNVIRDEAPDRLTLASASPTVSGATEPATDPDGVWTVADGSTVGYRVQEVLFGQTAEAVGRTQEVTGSMTVRGTTVEAAEFTVDMASVTSDESRRDDQFNGRIMETAAFPTATFELAEPVDLGEIPAEGEDVTFGATGNLTLHGVTKSVTVAITGRLTGSTVEVAGSIPIAFADYDIEDPSFAGVVTTEDNGILEFALNLER